MARKERQLVGLWIAALAVGGLLAEAVRLTLLPLLGDWVRIHATSIGAFDFGDAAIRVLVVLVAAVTAAAPSALVLGRRLPRIEIPWIEAGAIGTLVVFAIPVSSWLVAKTGDLMQAPAPPSLVVIPLISGIVSGCVIGLAQAIVLTSYVRGAVWWIVATVIADSISSVVTSLVIWQVAGGGVRFTTQSDYYAEAIVGALFSSAIVGAVTGYALVRLLGNLSPERAEIAS
jgi:hypothetical protein